MDDFEWDLAKAETNFAKHGIGFSDAARMFDAQHLTYRSHLGAEERFVSIGSFDGRIIAVIWTLRGFDTCRIISARRARPDEAEQYRKSLG